MTFETPIFRVGDAAVTCSVGYTGVASQSSTCTRTIEEGMIKTVEIQVRVGTANPNTASIQMSNFLNLLEDQPHSTKITV